MKLPASFIADETLPKSFIADKPLPGSFVPDEAPPLPESGAAKTIELGKRVAGGIAKTATFGAAYINALAGMAVGVPWDRVKPQWDRVKELGEAAPLEDISNVLAATTLIYGGISSAKALQQLGKMGLDARFIRKLDIERSKQWKAEGREVLPAVVPDAQLMNIFSTAPKEIQKEMAVYNPQMRRILQTGIPKPPMPTPEAPIAPVVAPRPIVAPPTPPAVVPAPIVASIAPAAPAAARIAPTIARPTITAPVPAVAVSPEPVGPSPKYSEFRDKVARKQIMESQGQFILDDMVDKNISPQEVAKEFYQKIYPNMPPKAKQYFSIPDVPESELIQSIDYGNDASYLTGTDRGHVALMKYALDKYKAPLSIPAPAFKEVQPQALVETPVETVKQPWEMNYKEYIDSRIEALPPEKKAAWARPGKEVSKSNVQKQWTDEHQDILKQALASGKPVPPEVLKDYPELKAQAKKPPVSVPEIPPAPIPAVQPPAGVVKPENIQNLYNKGRELARIKSGEPHGYSEVVGGINEILRSKGRGYPVATDLTRNWHNELVVYHNNPDIPPIEIIKSMEAAIAPMEQHLAETYEFKTELLRPSWPITSKMDEITSFVSAHPGEKVFDLEVDSLISREIKRAYPGVRQNTKRYNELKTQVLEKAQKAILESHQQKVTSEISNIKPRIIEGLGKTDTSLGILKFSEIRAKDVEALLPSSVIAKNAIVAINETRTKLQNVRKTWDELKRQVDNIKLIEKPPITPIKPPVVITELGAGPFPPKATRDALNSALASALPAEEKVNAMGQVLKFYLGTKRERFQVMAGDKVKGDAWYNAVRKMNANFNSIKAMVETRNREIFRGLPPAIREHIHDIAKGISKNASGEIVGGGIQPAGIMKDKNLRVGQVLPDGRYVGSALEEGGNEYQLYRKFDTLKDYTELIKKYPQSKVVFDRFLALNEGVVTTKLGAELPAFSREVMKSQYGIVTKHPQDYRWVPSMNKEERFFTKIGNLFKSHTASSRKYKTGILAETDREDKDFLRTLTSKQNEIAFENLLNDTVGGILATILEPIGKGGVKPGFKEVNINNPKLRKILDLKKDLLIANGIDVSKISTYQYPMNVDKEFNLSSTARFSPEMQSIVDSTARRTNQMVGFILSNYLIRPSTAVRNATSGFMQYNLRALTHLYEGTLGKGFSPAVNDVKALIRALKPSVIKELPAEILGLNFFSDIPENIKIMQTALIPFKSVEVYFKRVSFDADLSTIAGNKFSEALQAGIVRVSDKNKFIQDYRANYFQDLFNTMADNADSVTFDYGNKPYVLEKMANTIGRGFVPYPNYMYHKWRMYAEYSPLQLRDMNKFNYKNKIAKAMAGMTMFTISAAIASKVVEERKEKLKELELKKLPWEMDTTGRIKIYADDTVERWLRIYDLPFIGDTVYMMEILQNQAGVDDWMRDSLAMGPIFNTIAMFMGLKTKYTSGLATASIAGRQAVGFIPFGAYIQYLRVLADPIKRQTFSKDYNAFQNFVSPIINIVPDVSKGLPPQIGKTGEERGQIRKYDIPAETMKMFFLNIRSIDKKEYQQYVNDQMRSGKVMKRITKNIKESRIAGRNQ